MDIIRERVSAIMPVRDRFELARLALTAILQQSDPPEEVVIVDDGSTTPFASAIGDLGTAAAARGVALTVHRNPISQGVSAARNRGFQLSSGALACFCDSDDFWHPDKLKIIRATFALHSGIDILFHAYDWEDGTLSTFKWLPARKPIRLSRYLLVTFAILNPSCFGIRRTAFGAGFRQDMRHHEDLEYFLRLSKRNAIWFYNLALTRMSRAPGSEGGASHDSQAMRHGAVIALTQYAGPTLLGSVALLKISYHKVRALLDKVRARS